jgi:molybdate transport system substrate-binding protein
LKHLVISGFVLITSLSVISCTSSSEHLVIATAANTQFALEEIAKNFTRDTGIETRLVISSSGKHTAQILAGAPYDIFLSADLKYPQSLYEQKLTTAEPKIYAFGQLVLWSLDTTSRYNVYNLTEQNIEHLAIANPETAPYGIAAKEVLLNINIWDKLEKIIVYGESVAQTNQYILSAAAEVGFTASSIVLSPINRNNGRWTTIPDSLYTPIAQGLVILKTSHKPQEAEKFYQYLLSEPSQKMLRSYGYRTEVAK